MASMTETLPFLPKFYDPSHTQIWGLSELETAISDRYEEARRDILRYINQSRLTDVLWQSQLSNMSKKTLGYKQLSQIYIKLLQRQNKSAGIDTSCSISDRIEEPLISYLDEMVTKQLVSTEVQHTAIELWGKLEKASNFNLPEPDGLPGPECSFMLAFDDGTLHLEFEINKPNRVEAFFLNRDTDEMWEEDFEAHLDLSETLLEKIRVFQR